jgi:hypothetical protein
VILTLLGAFEHLLKGGSMPHRRVEGQEEKFGTEKSALKIFRGKEFAMSGKVSTFALAKTKTLWNHKKLIAMKRLCKPHLFILLAMSWPPVFG